MKKLLVLLALLTPFTAKAANGYEGAGIFTKKELDDVCTKLMQPIMRNYDVLNLKQVQKGDLQVGTSYINCSYSATTPEGSDVMVNAALNLSTNKIDALVIE